MSKEIWSGLGAESPNSRSFEATIASKRIGAKLGAAQLAALQRCTAVRFGPVFGGMNPPKQPILILWGQPPFLKNIALERQNITMEHKNSITMQALIDALEQESLLVDFSCPRQFYSHTFTYLSYSSADVEENTLFICKGAAFKAQYLQEAAGKGSAAYLAETKFPQVDLPYIQVTDIRRAMAVVSALFYGRAWQAMKVVGITGTKGKTTTTYFMKNILDQFCGKRTAVLSTIEVYTGVEDHDAHLTTPEAPDLHKHFAQVRQSGIPYMTMEVSSQAYKMHRVDGVEFDVGMFLNIGEDHIGPLEHEDFQDYLNCKLQLMSHCKTAVINKNADYFAEAFQAAQGGGAKVITYGTDSSCTYWVDEIEKTPTGFSFVIHGEGFQTPFAITMAGRFNVENALAAFAAAKALGIDDGSIAEGFAANQVRGRMNLFEKDGVTVIVDYAHNYLSFSKLYESLKLDYPGRRIVVVFGCPGGHAYLRRRDIGTLSGKYADYIYLTAEDPQFEDVTEICREIAAYIEPFHTPYEIIPDRTQAVEKAIRTAKEGDVILLAAKGEEVYQKVRGEYVYFESDIAITKRCLAGQQAEQETK